MTVKLHETTNRINIERGVRQGNTLSPTLFIPVLDHAKSITVDGEKLNYRRFADDGILIADSLFEVDIMLKIKTKFKTNLVLSNYPRISGEEIELVHQYIYLDNEIKIYGRDRASEVRGRSLSLGQHTEH